MDFPVEKAKKNKEADHGGKVVSLGNGKKNNEFTLWDRVERTWR